VITTRADPSRSGAWLPGYLAALAAVALCTAASWLLFHRFDPRNLAMIYLLGVAFVAIRFGRGPSVLASLAGTLSFEFLFMPPYFGFADDPQYVFTFAVMLVVALLISTLASRAREQAEEARRHARRTQILYAMTQDLAGLAEPAAIAEAAERHLADVFGSRAVVLPADPQGRLDPDACLRAEPSVLAAARAVVETARPEDRGTRASDSAFHCLPLRAGRQSCLGVLAVASGTATQSGESSALLDLLARQIAVSLERARLARQAEGARVDRDRERMRNALLSSVSHDLRTPLASITGAATSLLQDETLSKEARRELGATIHEESERLNRLVGNLLDMTRVRAGELRVAREWQSIEEVLGSALHRLRALLREREVAPRLPLDLPLVPMDAVLIEQVFVNLLENAVKHTPRGSRVEIAAVLKDEWIEVEVADAGRGLDPGATAAVFEGFRGGQEGVGLGLAICRAIVAAHGGSITAANREGGGASFRFTLPTRSADLAPVAAATK
jgi:two-component system sensor histidine kinase KdpD